MRQREKNLSPRISTEGAKYRYQLCNPSHVNPSTINPIPFANPHPSLLAQRMLEERNRPRQAFCSSQRNSVNVSTESAETAYYYCGNSLEAPIKDQDPSCKRLHTSIKHKGHFRLQSLYFYPVVTSSRYTNISQECNSLKASLIAKCLQKACYLEARGSQRSRVKEPLKNRPFILGKTIQYFLTGWQTTFSQQL